MTDPSDVAGVAGKLGAQSQERLRLGSWNISAWADEYILLGICERDAPHFIRLTPLGLAIRAHLLSTGAYHDR